MPRDFRDAIRRLFGRFRHAPSPLRAGLRQRMAASPLCDGKRFAANLVIVLREIWRRWIVQERR
jgi:predicted O-linked N-acetylglucosamine transferase (SPINDLY family)